MNGEVIKSFLVGLGFGVDDASLAKFNKSIATATLKVTALYTATKVVAAGIVYSISKISEGFEQLGYEYKILAPAINKALILRQELLKAYSAAGVNLTKVILSSVKLNLSLTKTKYAFEAIYKSVASRFFDLLTKQSDTFRQKIYANMPKIQAALESFVKIVFKALEATTALGVRLWSILTRVYEFFVLLDKATNGWSTIILGVVAAWKLLNLEFLATPLGMVIAGLVALLALFDDFKTFQEGGESFFDWTTFIPVIDAVTAATKAWFGVLQNVVTIVSSLFTALVQVLSLDFSGAWASLGTAGQAILDFYIKLWETIKGIGGALAALGRWGFGLFGNSNAAANLQNATGGVPSVSPIGGARNSQTNQNVNQQTNINVQTTADANATGKAIAGEQDRINYDLPRYLQSSTK